MTVPPCPFPGLLPFQEKDAPWFFGRDRETADLLGQLERSRFVAVIGVSGSGKSSLVHAGLKPELRLATPPWRMAEMKPGGGPQRALQSALESAVPGPDWASLLGRSSYGLVDVVAKAGFAPGEKLLVIVDQFEEIFSYRKQGHAEAEEADLFVQQLLRASAEPGAPIFVMLTMRTDYLGHCALFRNLAEALNEGTYLVPRLTRQAQEEAIQAPLAVSGVEIEPEVVDLLLNAAETNRDELPVLQHLLKRLWEEWAAARGGKGKIGRAEYDKTGGWNQAIAQDAESVFSTLGATEQSAIKLVFQRITEKGTGERPIRTPRSFSQLSVIATPVLAANELLQAMRAFRARDLLVWADDPDGGRQIIDIPHECVTWRWERLAQWIEEEDRDRRRLAFFAESAAAGTPLAGSALEEARTLRGRIVAPWVDRYKLDPRVLTQWIDHSEREATRARQRTRRLMIGLALTAVVLAVLGLWAWNQKREADTQRLRADLQRLEAEGHEKTARAEKVNAEKAADAAKIARIAAEKSAADALKERARAEGALASAEVNARQARYESARTLSLLATQAAPRLPQRGLLLALEALDVNRRQNEPPSLEAQRALRRALMQAGGRVLARHDSEVSLALSPDGRWIATSASDGVRLLQDPLNAAGPQSVVLPGAAQPVQFSPDSRWVVTALAGDKAALWNLAAGPNARPVILDGHAGPVPFVAFSPDGRWLVVPETKAGSVTFRAWDTRARQPGKEAVELGKGTAGFGVANPFAVFSKDGAWLVAGAWNPQANRGATMNPLLWKLSKSGFATTKPITLSGHGSSASVAVFSPDQNWLATASDEFDSHTARSDSAVHLWNLSEVGPESKPRLLEHDTGGIAALAFSPDGRYLASAAATKPGAAWRAGPEGRRSIRLWDLQSRTPASTTIGDIETDVTFLAIGGSASPHQPQWLAAVSGGTARLWNSKAFVDEQSQRSPGKDPRSPELLRDEASDSPLEITSTVLSSDGKYLVTGSGDGTARVWNLGAGDPTTKPRVLRGHEGRIGAVVFSPDMQFVATASKDKSARLWSMAPQSGAVNPIDFFGQEAVVSPDGRFLVSDYRNANNASDKTIRVWNLHADDKASFPATLRLSEEVYHLAVSRDSQWLLANDHGQSAFLWRLTDLAKGPARVRCDSKIFAIAISGDGRKAATGCMGGSVQLWDVEELRAGNARPRILSAHTNTIFHLEFSPDNRWLVSVDSDKKTFLWDVSTRQPAGVPVSGARPLAFSPTGRWLATADASAAWLHDLRSARPHAAALGKYEPAVEGIDFEARDRYVVVTSKSEGQVWDLTGAAPARAALPSVGSLAMFGGNRWLAATVRGRTALWDITTPAVEAPAYEFGGVIQGWSSNKRFLVTRNTESGKLVQRVWDLSDREPWNPSQPRVPIFSDSGTVPSIDGVLVTNDGRSVVTWTYDMFRTYRIWNTDLSYLQNLARTTAGRALQTGEGEQ